MLNTNAKSFILLETLPLLLILVSQSSPELLIISIIITQSLEKHYGLKHNGGRIQIFLELTLHALLCQALQV